MDKWWVIFLVGMAVWFAFIEWRSWKEGGTLSQRFWRALPGAPWLRVVLIVVMGAIFVWAIGHLNWKLW